MVFHEKKAVDQKQKMFFRKSLLAACICAASLPAAAQGDLEEVIVTGVRADLQSAQEIKRNSDTFVDAISADDIGSLPDRSVLEAMQRIPGISIERFAAANDPDHIGVEGSGAVIRGMSQTRSEFNGRDSFTANSGRGLNFQDVPPELMAGVDVYKNQTADMIEGGIGGTVSLRTRKPFDQDGRKVSFSIDGTYGDMVEEWTPTVSALFSDRWDTAAGEFGFLINVSDSELRASSHGIQADRYEFRSLESPGVAGGQQVPGFGSAQNQYTYDGSFFFGGPNSGEFNIPEVGTKGVLIPNGANMMMKEDHRERTGFGLSTQWQSNDETLLATFQYLRSDATLAWTENAVKYQTGFNTNRTFPDLGQEYQFDENGVFLSGGLADVIEGWRGDDDRIPHNATGWGNSPVYAFGHRFQTDNRYKKTRTVIDDFGFNLKWAPSDKFELVTDFQYIDASTEDDDVTMMLMTHAIMDLDLNGLPNVGVLSPWAYATEENIAGHAADGRDYANGFGDEAGVPYFQRKSSYNYNAAMDHFERSEGDSAAIRFDGTYNLDGGVFTKVKAGIRFAEREQTVRSSPYTWGRLAPIWDDSIGWLDGDLVKGTSLEQTKSINWNDFYRGGVANIDGGIALHPSDQLTQGYRDWGTTLAPFYNPKDNSTCNDEFRPAHLRVDATWDEASGACLPLNDLNGLFRESDINTTTESNQAAYVRFDYDTEVGGLRASGNVGLRYVRITNETEGSTTYPRLARSENLPADWDPNNVDPTKYDLFDPKNDFLGDVANYLPDHLLGFANDVYTPNVAKRTFDEWLPSANLKLELTPELIARFAASKAIALPDIGDLRNYTNIGTIGTSYTAYSYWNSLNPHPDAPAGSQQGVPVDSDGEPLEQTRIVIPETINFAGFNGSTGNPNANGVKAI
jgi:iron complex outermembrane receptor protein